LQKENQGLRNDLAQANQQLRVEITAELRECQRVISEHRNEERDRFYEGKVLIQLDGARTRDAVKENPRP
jgi:hypothetical protein